VLLSPSLLPLKVPLAECSERVYYRNSLFVPESEPLRLRLLQHCHRSSTAGHLSRDKTNELLARHYWCSNMSRTFRQYVRNCYTCARFKTLRSQYEGLLQPSEVPTGRWEIIAIDFIVGLPKSKSETTGQICWNIILVTDRLSKPRYSIRCGSIKGKYVARLFLYHIQKHYKHSETIVSDWGPHFASKLWQLVC
jgi:hypothetical protein